MQQLRRQLGDVAIPLGLLHKLRHVGQGVFQLGQPRFQCGQLFPQPCLLCGVFGGEQAEVFVGDASQHIVLIEPFE